MGKYFSVFVEHKNERVPFFHGQNLVHFPTRFKQAVMLQVGHLYGAEEDALDFDILHETRQKNGFRFIGRNGIAGKSFPDSLLVHGQACLLASLIQTVQVGSTTALFLPF